MIPYGRQNLNDHDVQAVVQALHSEWLTQGPTVPLFEQAVTARAGVAHAVAVNSATSALHLACMALELGPGDRLWTSPNTFVASANCARYCGAQVDFVDIDPRTYNLSTTQLAVKLAEAERSRTLPKVVIPVHFAGQPCEMAAIATLARRYGFKVIEDASHAIGGRYRGGPVGNCSYSDVTVFSFHPVKIITTAEGGMALTNSSELATRMRCLRSHGVTRDTARMESPTQEPWYYEQVDLGFNYRMTDVQAALGLSQLRRLDEFLERRRQIARIYDKSLAGLPLVRPFQHPDTESAFHLYVVQVDPGNCPVDRRAAFERLRAAGIGVNVHYIPVHTQPYYRRMGFRGGMYPAAERYYMHALSLPMFVGLSDADIGTVVSALRESLRG
jgi:UDP-4-amino-4,6-dideoxy-N-acetyl-beta-L-altrosamine transaminase